MARNIENLKKGGAPHRGKGGKFYLGIAFRNAFTPEDMTEFALSLKEISLNKEEKTADRLKAFDIILKKLVADEVADEQSPVVTLDIIKEKLKDAGYTITPIE